MKKDEQIITIEEDTIFSVFTEDKGLVPHLDKIKTKAVEFSRGFNADTPTGRKAIKSVAYSVTRSKTYIDDMGKALKKSLNEQSAPIDPNRKAAREFLENLAAEISEPVTKWEAEEEKKKAQRTEALAILEALPVNTFEGVELTVKEMQSRLEQLRDLDVTEDDFGDMYQKALDLKDNGITAIHVFISNSIKRERDAAELETLRKEKEANQKLIDEAQAVKDAEAAKVAHEKEIAERAEIQAREAVEAKEQAERDLVEQKKQAEADQIAAVEQTKIAEAARIQAEEKRKADEATAREANKAHKGKINRLAVKCIRTAAPNVSEEDARLIVSALALKQIENVVISY